MIRSILLVDDDLLDQTIFKLALKSFNPDLKVTVAGNGILGLKALEKQIPDIIFLDQNMPEMGGLEFLQIVKADPRFSRIPVVVFTPSLYLSSHNKELTKCGAYKYVVKDLSVDGKGGVIEIIKAFNKQSAA